ncbi:hypothetical protein BYT27DRAFT_6940389 [Phlegmacium glaucopus]|nr:hypothetical protein BYT27DRAFT_6665090 [Phlegmacium glaucopus]KAF8814953.1 hypothetical protein BYT27DRAFT_6940389 [Phlegmacium glaucopus]
MPRAQTKKQAPRRIPVPSFHRPLAHRFSSSPRFSSPTASSSSEIHPFDDIEYFEPQELNSICRTQENLLSVADLLWDRTDLSYQFRHYFETTQTIRRLEAETKRQEVVSNLLFDRMKETGFVRKIAPLIRHHRQHQWSHTPFKNEPRVTNRIYGR